MLQQDYAAAMKEQIHPLLLHAKNATEEGYEAIVIISVSTNIFALAVPNSYHIQALIYQKCGTQVSLAEAWF